MSGKGCLYTFIVIKCRTFLSKVFTTVCFEYGGKCRYSSVYLLLISGAELDAVYWRAIPSPTFPHLYSIVNDSLFIFYWHIYLFFLTFLYLKYFNLTFVY